MSTRTASVSLLLCTGDLGPFRKEMWDRGALKEALAVPSIRTGALGCNRPEVKLEAGLSLRV